MLQKSVLLFMVCFSMLYSLEPKITTSVILKNAQEKQKQLFKMLNTKPVDFIPINNYGDMLLSYGFKDENFDYCLNVINKTTDIYGEDSMATKISYLLLARHYLYINKIEVAKEIIDYVIETTQNQKYEHYKFYRQTIDLFHAGYYETTNNYEKAYKIYKYVLKTDQYLKSSDKIYIFNQLASILNIFGDYDKSIKYTKKALSIEKKSKLKKHKDLVVDTFINYSKSYSLRGDYSYAIAVLEVLITIYQKENILFFPEMRNIYTEYSSLLVRLNSWKATKNAAKKSLFIQEELQIKDDYISFINYVNIAKVEEELKHYNKSKEVYIKALALLRQINIPISMKEKYMEYINNKFVAIKNLQSSTKGDK